MKIMGLLEAVVDSARIVPREAYGGQAALSSGEKPAPRLTP